MYISSAMRTLTLILLTTLFCTLTAAQQASAPPAGVPEVRISQLEMLESSPKVKYPMTATEQSLQGQVVLGLTIAADGKVEQVDVLEGPRELSEPTVKTVRKWAFKPFLEAGQPRRVYTRATFNFAFHDRVKDFKDPLASTTSAPPADDPNASATPKRVRVSQGVGQGMLLHQVKPVYPPDARHNRIQGQVVLAAAIGTNGNIQELRVVSGHPMLAEAAMAAVRQWHYRPYMINGEPVIVETQITVNFTLSF
jgi:TonB family protein